MIKSNVKLLFILPVIFFLTFCGHNKDEKREINEYEKQGKINAIKYIENKYSFTPKIIKVSAITQDAYMVPDLFTQPTGTVLASMSYNNKSFKVLISGEKETIIGFDDYQSDEIIEAILEEVKKDTNIDPYAYSIKYGESEYDNLINKYYNGNNLDEILTNDILNTKMVNIILEYINKDELKTNNFTNIKDKFINASQFSLINYHTNNKRSKDLHDVKEFGEYIEDNALNIQYALHIKGRTFKEYNISLYKYDDMYFVDLTDNATIKVKKINAIPAEKWKGNGAANPKTLLDTYSIESDAKIVHIYIPINKTNNVNMENLVLANQCTTSSKTSYSGGPIIKKTGDYYVDYIALYNCEGDLKFTILKK